MSCPETHVLQVACFYLERSTLSHSRSPTCIKYSVTTVALANQKMLESVDVWHSARGGQSNGGGGIQKSIVASLSWGRPGQAAGRLYNQMRVFLRLNPARSHLP